MDILKMTKEDCKGLTYKMIVPYLMGEGQNGWEKWLHKKNTAKPQLKLK
jgi:hypothetical protein